MNPLSEMSLRSSIGGYAPYSSTEGMLISSIQMIIFLPGSGPISPLESLVSFPSIEFCVISEDVCAEKMSTKLSIFFSFMSSSLLDSITDFPVPDAPVT
jgi:hypothetical protein